MRLTLKLTLAMTAAILAVLAVFSTVRVKREVALFEGDMQRDSQLFGRAIAGAAARIWVRVGIDEAIDLVENANQREGHVTIRWVWLDGSRGDPYRPGAPIPRIDTSAPLVVRWHLVGADAPSIYTYVPVQGPDRSPAAIELHESLAAEHAYIRDTIVQAIIATASLVLLGALLTLGLGAIFVGRPVRHLVAYARQIGEGVLDARLAVRQRDEIGELGHAMNTMSTRLDEARRRLEQETSARMAALEQLRHADRLATVGKLSAGIAHEIGTPLNVITGYAQLISVEAPAPSPLRGHAEIISQQVVRVAGIVRQLLDFARPRPPRKERRELGAIGAQSIELLTTLARKREVELVVEASSTPVHASIDPGQMGQVVTNLLVNALHASAPGTRITVSVSVEDTLPPADRDLGPGRFACLRVRDQGTGIPADVLPRIFEPFFTTKEIGEGTGLGLSVVHGIVKEHGGWIAVTTEPGRGTVFAVYVPVAVEDEP